MCNKCMRWDSKNGGCMIHNTIPGGCKDFCNARSPLKNRDNDWILCSERLPEKVGNYIIHTKTGTGEDYVGMWCYQRGVHLSGNQTYVDDKQGYWANAFSGDPINEPLSKSLIAWQPLPEPYKAD